MELIDDKIRVKLMEI